jgi:hypothetical protein
MSMKNFNRTRDLATCSAVPEPTAPPCAPIKCCLITKYKPTSVKITLLGVLLRLLVFLILHTHQPNCVKMLYFTHYQNSTVKPDYNGTARDWIIFRSRKVPINTGTLMLNPRDSRSWGLIPLQTSFRYVQIPVKKGVTVLVDKFLS